MNQPELGKKVAELRRAKGLTQEELVSKCNVTVRTLQRIESGVVTPRSYTIKTLFAALDYDIYNFSESSPSKEVPSFFEDKVEQLYRSVIDMFNLKTNTMKKISILSVVIMILSLGLFLLSSESKAQKSNLDKFVSSTGRGVIYLFPKEFRKGSYISNLKDTADYKFGKYLIQEYKHSIFLNKKFVGKVLEGDTVVVNKGKVTIRKSYWEGNSDIGSGIIYLFPRNLYVTSRSHYKDTVTWHIENSYIKEYANKIFLNDIYLGTAKYGDTLRYKNGTLKFIKTKQESFEK
jgi:transcriptional regulator with XRE-family HTH domain